MRQVNLSVVCRDAKAYDVTGCLLLAADETRSSELSKELSCSYMYFRRENTIDGSVRVSCQHADLDPLSSWLIGPVRIVAELSTSFNGPVYSKAV